MQSRGWRADTGDGATRLARVDFTLDELGDDEVLVSVEAAVVGDVELSTPGEQIVGGGCVGRVIAAGDAATALMEARVAVGPVMPCGECDVCRRGAAAACPTRHVLGVDRAGTLATHVIAKARWVCDLRAPLELPTPAAALLGREATSAYAMYVRAGVAPGEPVVILGENASARLLAQIAVAKGVAPMVVTTADAPWNPWLRDNGATPIERGDPDDVDGLLADLTEAATAAGYGSRPWRIFVTTHHASDRGRAFAVAGAGSTIALLGPPSVPASPEVTVDLARGLGCDVSVICVAAGHPDLIPEVAALCVRGQLDLESAMHAVPADGVAAAVENRASTHASTTEMVVLVNENS